MLGLFVASALLPGVAINGVGTFILAAVLLGIVNAIVRPIALLMTLPLTLLTLGLFLFVVNAAMFGLVAAMLDGFVVAGVWSAVFGSVVVRVAAAIASWYVGPDGRVQVYVIRSY